MRITVLLLLLSASIGKAQNGPFLFDEQLRYALEDERLRSNAVLLSEGSMVTWQDFDSVISNSIDSLQVQFNSDSIHWSFIKDSVPFQVNLMVSRCGVCLFGPHRLGKVSETPVWPVGMRGCDGRGCRSSVVAYTYLIFWIIFFLLDLGRL